MSEIIVNSILTVANLLILGMSIKIYTEYVKDKLQRGRHNEKEEED